MSSFKCAIPTNTDAGFSENVSVRLYGHPDGARLVIEDGGTTFGGIISHEASRRVARTIFGDGIDLDLMNSGDMDDVYGRWYRMQRPASVKGPSR